MSGDPCWAPEEAQRSSGGPGVWRPPGSSPHGGALGGGESHRQGNNADPNDTRHVSHIRIIQILESGELLLIQTEPRLM